MKYRQHGGGKIPQKVKFTYLRHCQRLIDNNDVVSKNYLLLALKNYSVNNIMQFYQHELIEQIIGDFRTIWDLIDQSDRNYLRMVNVVSFQLSVLFTYACLDFREPTLADFNNSERQLSYFKEFTNEIKYRDLPENSSRDWRNYKHVKKHGRLLKKMSASESENASSNGIITILDYLTLDDIIKPYLNGWFICGLVYTKTYADNKEMLPFAFIEHDIVHYYNYTYTCFTRAGAELPVLLRLYRFINRIYDKKMQYSAKLLFFIIVHEGLCQWDDAGFLQEGNILNSSSRFYSSAVQQERFIDDTDLGLLIPKTERNDTSRRLTYLENALTIYRETLGHFKELDSFIDEPFVAFPNEGDVDTNDMDAFGLSAEELFASMDVSRPRHSDSIKSEDEDEDDFNKCNKLYCENKIYNEQDYEDAIEKQGKYGHLSGNVIDKLIDTRDDCFQAYYRDWANGPASISDCRDESSSGSLGSSGSSGSSGSYASSVARGKKSKHVKKTKKSKKSKKSKRKSKRKSRHAK